MAGPTGLEQPWPSALRALQRGHGFQLSFRRGLRSPGLAPATTPPGRGFEPCPLNAKSARLNRRSFNSTMAGPTGLEPATSGVTGLRSNQLSYDPARGDFRLFLFSFFPFFLLPGAFEPRPRS